jgi:hypothetical protein
LLAVAAPTHTKERRRTDSAVQRHERVQLRTGPVSECLRVRLHALFSGLLALAITLSLGGDAAAGLFRSTCKRWRGACGCGQDKKIEAVEKQRVLPVRRSLVRRWTAFGMMKQRTLLQITVGCYHDRARYNRPSRTARRVQTAIRRMFCR